jgi:ethanolamine utilization protein EutP (predicted NTPase)
MRDGEPCSHKGCLSHISHPCEGCGRIGGRKVITYIVKADMNKIQDIEKRFNVTWKSGFLEGLIFIESTESEEVISNFDGIISCREQRIGTFN